MSNRPESEPVSAARVPIHPEAWAPYWSWYPTRDAVINATHNADHVKLDESVHLTIQHLREQLLALHRKGEAIEQAHAGWGSSAFGLPKPTGHQQQLLFDLHREFFDLTYSTLSALAASLNRLTKHVRGVPFNSNSRFITWLKNERQLKASPMPEVLMSARDFRTIYVHPAQFKPINWATVMMGSSASVVLVGAGPPWPDGVARTDPTACDLVAD
jgi:hypothetical protein